MIRDGQGRTLWAGAVRPGRMHDQTAVNTEGIAELLTQHPGVKVRVDDGYRGLASACAEQVTAPPRKPAKDAAAELVAAYRQARTQQSSRRRNLRIFLEATSRRRSDVPRWNPGHEFWVSGLRVLCSRTAFCALRPFRWAWCPPWCPPG